MNLSKKNSYSPWQEHKHFEDAFQAYEKGVGTHPGVRLVESIVYDLLDDEEKQDEQNGCHLHISTQA